MLKDKTKKEKSSLWSILLICVGLVALVAVYIFQVDSRTIHADLYRYAAGQRFDYQDTSKVIKTKKGFVLKNGEKEQWLDAAPLYYQDQERIFLPKVMAAYCPFAHKFGKLDYFSEIYKDETGVFVQNGSQKIPLPNGFLYDGSDLYLFMEKTIVQWNDEVVMLEPFSYAVVLYNRRLELYSVQNGKCVLADTGICKVMAKTESGYSVNLSTDILYRVNGNEQVLLAHPLSLKSFAS